MASSSPHVFHLARSEPYFENALGSIQRVTAAELPLLRGMSLKRLILGGKGCREPHWHANTPELGYCLSGSALVTIIDTHSQFSRFTIKPGQMFHVPSGSLHAIENISDTEPVELLICFRHESPKDFSLAAAYGAMTPAVLGNTWNLPASALSSIRLSTEQRHIVARDGPATVPKDAGEPNLHKFDVEGTEPNLKGEDLGEIHQAKQSFWPSLESLAMYSLVVEDKAMREPHWHPITAEMGYVHRGCARMTVQDPQGNADTYTLRPGDVYYIPAAYPHQIEVLPEGGQDIHFCIFFDQPMPQDIGFKATAHGIPHELMAATLGVGRANLPNLQGTTGNPLIVSRCNPVDEVIQWTE